MRCPFCRTRLTEHTAACPACHLTRDRVSTLLGPADPLASAVTDHCKQLTHREISKLEKRIQRMSSTLPQVRFRVVLQTFPAEHPFDLHIFWLFNCGGLPTDDKPPGENRNILLALDPSLGRSALMLGYGLEPFIADDALDHLLESAEPAWVTGDWSGGILRITDALQTLLKDTVREISDRFGLHSSHPEDKRPARRSLKQTH